MLAGPTKVGALFTSVIITLNEFVALRAGEPLSVTLVVKTFVLGPWASVGVQRMMPVASKVAPVGLARKT